MHADDAQGKFYHDLMIDFAHRGRAVAYELYLGKELVAARLCIASSDMLVILKKSFHERYSDYSPSRLLLYNLLEYEFNRRRFNNIEFYTNANIDMQRWATDTRMITHVTLFKNQAIKTAYVLACRVRDVFRSWHHPMALP